MGSREQGDVIVLFLGNFVDTGEEVGDIYVVGGRDDDADVRRFVLGQCLRQTGRFIPQCLDGGFDFLLRGRSDGAGFIDDAADRGKRYASGLGDLVDGHTILEIIHDDSSIETIFRTDENIFTAVILLQHIFLNRKKNFRIISKAMKIYFVKIVIIVTRNRTIAQYMSMSDPD